MQHLSLSPQKNLHDGRDAEKATVCPEKMLEIVLRKEADKKIVAMSLSNKAIQR